MTAVGESHAGVIDFSQPASPETMNTLHTPRFAPGQSQLLWPSVASDAHDPGFRLPGLGASPKAIRAEHVAVVAQLLSQLRHLDLIGRLLNEYYDNSPAALVPGPLILPALSELQARFSSASSPSMSGGSGFDIVAAQVAESVVELTSFDIEIDLSSSPSDFCATYTGASLRLEAVGLIFVLAGRSCLLGPGRGDDRRDEFVHAMFRCSTCCLQITREVAPQVNDPTVWLSYENLLLTMSIQGDASESRNVVSPFVARRLTARFSLTVPLEFAGPNVWRRLGDLSTDVHALGVHRESTHADKMPFFLSDCRRRTFAAAYQVDKLICTFFDRPPRILRRYSDCKMPLDLSIEELLGNVDELDRARLSLDGMGWNTQARYVSSTWARLRYLLGVFREEILEYPFRLPSAENRVKLLNLSERCQQSWRSLPEHLKYTSQCWTSGLDATVCLMLTIVHLSHLQNEFQIQRLLEKSERSSASALLSVSAEIVAVIVQLGNSRDRAVLLRHDFPYVVVNYGLPSAATLATLLQTNARSRAQALPKTLSRSALIRSLTLFNSYLENIGSPGEPVHQTCVQAAQAISRTLDDMLNYSPSAPAAPAALPATQPAAPTAYDILATPFSPSQSLLLGPEATSFSDFDLLNSNALDGFDLSGWMKNIDWTGNNAPEWGTF